jgi:DNA-binding transcriptional regulator of glucitol operon
MTVSVTELPQSETAGAVPLWKIAVLVIVIVAAGFLAIVWWNRRQQSFLKMFNGSNGTTE